MFERRCQYLRYRDLLNSPHFLRGRMYQTVHKNVHCRDSILSSDFALELARRQSGPEGTQPLKEFPTDYAIKIKSALYK